METRAARKMHIVRQPSCEGGVLGTANLNHMFVRRIEVRIGRLIISIDADKLSY